jgi:hypothetical protein
VARRADISSIAARTNNFHQSPHSFGHLTNSEQGDLDHSRRLQVAGWGLALSESPVSQLDHQVVFSLGLDAALAIHSHHLVSRLKSGGLSDSDIVRLQIHGGRRVVCQLPVQRSADVDAITTNSFYGGMSIGSLHSGTRECSGYLPMRKNRHRKVTTTQGNGLLDSVLLKVQGGGLSLSKSPVRQQNDVAVITDARNVAVAIHRAHGIKNFEVCTNTIAPHRS